MWTQEQRRICRREGDGDPSKLRDAEREQLELLIPTPRPNARSRFSQLTFDGTDRKGRDAPVD